MADPQGGFGLVLKIYTAGALTAITRVTDCTFPEFEKILADVTSHDSTGGWDEQVDTGRRQSGELEATLNWDVNDTVHAAIVTAFDSTADVQMSIADPDGDETITFQAHIRRISRIAQQTSGYQAKVTIKPTGTLPIT